MHIYTHRHTHTYIREIFFGPRTLSAQASKMPPGEKTKQPATGSVFIFSFLAQEVLGEQPPPVASCPPLGETAK
jgi:hypothetical protein